ncbi:hypothetical protein EYF80_061367 [Liparis tanakae]|uniref:Uncharacterized protein n=1 Tax=Liparis tanakae TaxID=230148 RepID=A0A4Z2EJ71_9TELE|nr:hypothetical protein EYF80_061367 [Liparis tanakae]
MNPPEVGGRAPGVASDASSPPCGGSAALDSGRATAPLSAEQRSTAVDDDSDEEVESEEAADGEGDEVQTDQLQQSQVSAQHVVVVEVLVPPVDPRVPPGPPEAVRLVVHVLRGEPFPRRLVDAGIEPSREQAHSQDTEGRPEDQNHQQEVQHGRDGPDQSLHHPLHTDRGEGDRSYCTTACYCLSVCSDVLKVRSHPQAREARDDPQEPQRPEAPHQLEGPQPREPQGVGSQRHQRHLEEATEHYWDQLTHQNQH